MLKRCFFASRHFGSLDDTGRGAAGNQRMFAGLQLSADFQSGKSNIALFSSQVYN
ncbi:MAG: hypothetical protein FWC21_04840 [Treponema sp.]|nr:hypothetical protein [Treponema sp.]